MPEQRVIPMFSYEDVGRARRGLDRGGLRLTETGRWSDDVGRVRMFAQPL